MKTTRTKILFASMFFSVAMPFMIFSAEEEIVSTFSSLPEKIWELVGFISKNDPTKVEQWLAENKNLSLNTLDKVGNLPLQYTIYDNRTEIAKLLMQANANVNCKDKNGCTALHTASSHASGDYQKIVKLFLKHGADPHIKDNSGNTPLTLAKTLAKKTKNYKVLKLLNGEDHDE